MTGLGFRLSQLLTAAVAVSPQQASPLAAMTLRTAVPDTWADTEPVTPDTVAAPVPSSVTAAVAILPTADIEPVLQARHSLFSALNNRPKTTPPTEQHRPSTCLGVAPYLAAEKTPLQAQVLADWTCSSH